MRGISPVLLLQRPWDYHHEPPTENIQKGEQSGGLRVGLGKPSLGDCPTLIIYPNLGPVSTIRTS